MAARWRKTPRPRGLSGTGFLQGFELRDGDKTLLRVSATRNMGEFHATGWFWSGQGQNSCESPAKTAEAARVQADVWYKANKDKLSPT